MRGEKVTEEPDPIKRHVPVIAENEIDSFSKGGRNTQKNVLQREVPECDPEVRRDTPSGNTPDRREKKAPCGVVRSIKRK